MTLKWCMLMRRKLFGKLRALQTLQREAAARVHLGTQVKASVNISTSASAILSGDYKDDVPISKAVKLVGKISLVKDYLTGRNFRRC